MFQQVHIIGLGVGQLDVLEGGEDPRLLGLE